MKNLLIIKSPLQLINALEAIDYFKLKNNILVVLHDGSKENLKQINKLILYHEWQEVITVYDRKYTKFIQYLSLLNKLKKEKYNYVFFGELGIIQRMIVANTIKKELFYIDDGGSTITEYNNKIKHNKLNKYSLREFRYLLFGFKIKINDTINLFTYYDLEPLNNKIIKNNLSFFKTNYINKLEKSDDVYFLGMPIENVMNINVYIKFLQSIILKYPSQKIIYIPHRREDFSQKNLIRELVNSRFEFREISTPIEIYYFENNILPSTVLSFFSTALKTLKILYDIDNIHSVEINRDLLIDKSKYDISLKEYYNNLKENEIIRFEDLNFK